jgi:uncharacterized PurR-regulated membrane protein YhhQ (DUF165 family)
LIAFAGRESWSTILSLVFWGYWFKVLYEMIATPLTYLIVNKLKRAQGIDVYDRGRILIHLRGGAKPYRR